MDPGVADLEALLATLGCLWRNVAYLVEVGTRGAHADSFNNGRFKPYSQAWTGVAT
jgi:hypothetical protein